MGYDLNDRHVAYELAYEQKIIRRIPVILRVDGRAFRRVTKKLSRPYCARFINLMAQTMLDMVKEIDGCVFAYQQSDEITFVLRNDQTLETQPWFGNSVQDMVAASAALTTYHFNNNYRTMDNAPQDLVEPAVFRSKVFGVPSVNEVVNNLIWRQFNCHNNATAAAALSELIHEFGRETATEMLEGKSSEVRIQLLADECGVDFYQDYPARFRRGVAAYKIPTIIEGASGKITRHRWAIDNDLPFFVEKENRQFLTNILNSGGDIFRPERDLEE